MSRFKRTTVHPFLFTVLTSNQRAQKRCRPNTPTETKHNSPRSDNKHDKHSKQEAEALLDETPTLTAPSPFSDDLPLELHIHLSTFLDARSLLCCKRVNRCWNSVLSTEAECWSEVTFTLTTDLQLQRRHWLQFRPSNSKRSRISLPPFDLIHKSMPFLHSLQLQRLSHLHSSHIAMIARTMKRQLLHLDLTGCQSIGDVAVKSLADHCNRLVSLDLSECSISDTALIHLSQASFVYRLKALSLSGCKALTKSGFSQLSSLNQLKVFSGITFETTTRQLLKSTLLSGVGASLKSLQITVFFHQQHLLNHFQSLRHLTILSLSLTNLNDDVLSNIGEHLKNLSVLHLSCSELSVSGTVLKASLKALSEKLRDLLLIEYHTGYHIDTTSDSEDAAVEQMQLSAVDLTAALSYCQQLNSLVCRCARLVDDALVATLLPKHLNQLTCLDLSCNIHLTDSSVRHLITHCTHLQRLNLDSCTAVNSCAVRAAHYRFKHFSVSEDSCVGAKVTLQKQLQHEQFL